MQTKNQLNEEPNILGKKIQLVEVIYPNLHVITLMESISKMVLFNPKDRLSAEETMRAVAKCREKCKSLFNCSAPGI